VSDVTRHLAYLYLLFTALVLAGCGERQTYTFAAGDEARSSEVARRGWIPPWLPSSARAIQLEYDLDTNERWLRFSLPVGKRSSLVAGMRRLTEAQIAQLNIRRPRSSWWFQGLIQQQPANDGALYAEVFELSGRQQDHAFVLLERESDTVFAYFPSS
jgi:hypothetical protein